MQAIPRVGDFVKFTLEGEDDYVPWRVPAITYRESGAIEVSTELLDDLDGRGYSFEAEEDFDETVKEYQTSGWHCPHGIRANTRVNIQASQAQPQG